jgi:Ca-activated chloride channel homolog
MFFRDPQIIFLIPLILVLFLFMRIRERPRAFLFSSDRIVRGLRRTVRSVLSGKLVYLKIAALILFLIALARPHLGGDIIESRDAIAVMIAIDSSSSMLAEDLTIGSAGLARWQGMGGPGQLNRIDAVKMVARDFVERRSGDIIGLVAFASQAYVIVPPTFDKKWLNDGIDRVEVGMIADATAIGSGIMSSLSALKDIEAESRVIVLLTDGENNFGDVPPLVAARAARAMGIKIYTVGIFSRGQTPFPVQDALGRKVYKNIRIEIDTDLLREISALTGGEFYGVSDIKELRNSLHHIDSLEKTEIDETRYDDSKDMFSFFLLPAIALLIMERILGNTVLRKVP